MLKKVALPLLLFLLLLFWSCKSELGSNENNHSVQLDSTLSGVNDTAHTTTSEKQVLADAVMDSIILGDTLIKNLFFVAVNTSETRGYLRIKDNISKKILQTLPYEVNGEDRILSSINTNDFNFDGYIDICLPNGYNEEGGVPPTTCSVFLFNTFNKRFEKSEDFSAIISSGDSYEIIKNRKLWILYRKGGSAENYYNVYKINNGKACQIKSLIEAYFKNKVVVSVEKTDCNGKVKAREKEYEYPMYAEDYEGKGYYYKHIE